jgi:hypothetical protein
VFPRHEQRSVLLNSLIAIFKSLSSVHPRSTRNAILECSKLESSRLAKETVNTLKHISSLSSHQLAPRKNSRHKLAFKISLLLAVAACLAVTVLATSVSDDAYEPTKQRPRPHTPLHPRQWPIPPIFAVHPRSSRCQLNLRCLRSPQVLTSLMFFCRARDGLH